MVLSSAVKTNPSSSAASPASADRAAEFLTTRQIQEILHVDRTTIYRMADDGRIPAVKIGGQWRFPRRPIENWLKRQSNTVARPTETVTDGASSDLEKLLPLECVQKIQDAFADILGVMMVLTDLDGKPVTQVSHACGLYDLAAQSPAARTLLQQEWAKLAGHPSLQPEFVSNELRLLSARGLVRVGSELKAMLVVAGIAPRQWPPSDGEIAGLAERLQLPAAVVGSHLNNVCMLSPEQQQQVLAYVQRIADIVAHIITERNVLFTKLQNIAELTRF